ncbi:MAG: hypothetical protein FWH56_06110 [Betaproteobacteria bacterium]|nr:hypothetical protein [Betaproteobacteria bacterium]
MSFFQGFISDGNRNRQSLGRPVERVAENPVELMSAEPVDTPDAFATSLRLETPTPGIQTLSDATPDVAAPPVSKHDEQVISKSEPVPRKATLERVGWGEHREPQRVGEAFEQKTDSAHTERPTLGFASSSQPTQATHTEPEARVGWDEHRKPQRVDGAFEQKTDSAHTERPTLGFASSPQPTQATHTEPEARVGWGEHREPQRVSGAFEQKTDSAHTERPMLGFASSPQPTQHPQASPNPPVDASLEHGPDAIPALPRHGLTKTQAAMTREAVAQQSDATITAASIRQAKEALGLFSADAPSPPSPTREKREPQVQIGTIEVIVESTPVVQRSSSQNTGFTRDPGRYYQRRL